MKSTFKKFLAIILGFLMFLFPSPRASAYIEVVEFSDGSRLTRFGKEDLQSMVEYFQTVVLDEMKADQEAFEEGKFSTRCIRCCGVCKDSLTEEKEEKGCCACCSCCSCCQTKKHRVTKASIGWAITFLLGTVGFGSGTVALISKYLNPGTISGLYGAVVAIAVLVSALFGACGCDKCCCKCCSCCGDSGCCGDGGYSGAITVNEEICDQMKDKLKELAGDGLLVPLVAVAEQDSSESFLLLERPRGSIGVDPKPFFVTDRDASLVRDLRINNFLALIQHVCGKLCGQGISIRDKYILTKLGNHFAPISKPDIMSEAVSVQVVVDGGEDEGPNA